MLTSIPYIYISSSNPYTSKIRKRGTYLSVFLQEISFEQLWHSSGAGITVDVELSRLEGSSLTCLLVAQQICSANTQTLRINSDFPYAPVTQLASSGELD